MFIINLFLCLYRDAKLVKVKNNQVARKELLDFEKLEIRTCFKFGIVYCKEDERDEDNLFGASKQKYIQTQNVFLLHFYFYFNFYFNFLLF